MAETEKLDVEAVAAPKSAKSDSLAVKGLYFGEVEQSFQESTYYPDSQKKPYNPDPLVMKDYTYGVYEEMLQDDQVDVALNLKKDLVIGSGWHIQHEDENVRTELEESLSDDCDRPFSEILRDMLQAYEYGFSLSEKLFYTKIDGQLALKDIKPRHPSSWLIHTDEHGNVFRYEQRGPKNSIDLNPDAIIHYKNNEQFQNPYGRSDLYSAYQAWITKRHITRFYAVFLENAAGAKPVAKYDRKAPQAAVDAIFTAIKSFQTKTAMAIPKDFEVEFLEAKNNGESYTKGINLFNMFIGRALFIPDLLGFSGSETGGGSFSLGKEQIGLFYKHINRRREILENLIDKHIMRPLAVYNYGVMDKYPKFKFNPLSDDDAKMQAEMWIKGVQGAGWNPTIEEVNHFRRLIKFPESEELEMKAQLLAEQQGDNPEGEEENEEAGTDKEKDGDDDSKGKGKAGDKEASEDAKEDASKKEFALKLDTLKGDYHRKTNFKLADQILKTTLAKIKTEAEPIIDDIFEDLYDQMQKKKIIQTQNLERAESLELKYTKKMQIILKKNFRRLYQDAQAMAQTEVKKSDFGSNIPADEFLNFIEQETYKYIGKWSYDLMDTTKNELIRAIKDGLPLSNVIGVLDTKGRHLTETSLERYARTKVTEVFNRGRMEYFDSTGVVEAYQYSAILDDVTSDICGNLHGLTFAKEDAPCPPLHFNCRSVLVPITRFEKWSADKATNSGQGVDKFLEKNVTDKGFSVF